MNRGICFEVPRHRKNVLLDFFSCLEETYDWFCVLEQTDVLDEITKKDLFKKMLYSQTEIIELLKVKHNVYFLKLVAFKETKSVSNISNYDKFLSSESQIVILINDCVYCEVYVKDIKLTSKLFEVLTAYGYANVEYITDKSDQRVKFNVL